jgi:hypothetical protein
VDGAPARASIAIVAPAGPSRLASCSGTLLPRGALRTRLGTRRFDLPAGRCGVNAKAVDPARSFKPLGGIRRSSRAGFGLPALASIGEARISRSGAFASASGRFERPSATVVVESFGCARRLPPITSRSAIGFLIPAACARLARPLSLLSSVGGRVRSRPIHARGGGAYGICRAWGRG